MSFEEELQTIRTSTINDKRLIQIKDFGAGSKKLGTERSISDIYNTSVASLKFQRLLFQITKHFKCVNVLEMGTSLGFSTVYLSKATKAKVTTIEACPATHREAKSLIHKMNLNNINSVNSTFSDYFESNSSQPFDLVYIDGHHDGVALLNYVEILKPRLCEPAILIVDDIRWSKGMYQAWMKLNTDFDIIKQSHSVMMTVDIN